MYKKIAKPLLIVYILFLLYLTIFSREMMLFQYSPEQIIYSYLNIPNWMPFDSIHLYINANNYELFALNIIGNIVVFIPLTIFSCFIYKKWYTNIFITLLLTWTIEVSQLLLICGSFDVDDVLLNLLGGCIGVIIFKFIQLVNSYIQKQRV